MMPNRIIRDGHLDSERANALWPMAEIFYDRLRLVVDDYGRFEYRPILLLSKAFPLRPGRYTSEMVQDWMSELTAGEKPLVITYQHGNKVYLEIQTFGQRIRKCKKTGQLTPSKFPAPRSAARATTTTTSPSLGLEGRKEGGRDGCAAHASNRRPSEAANTNGLA